MAESPLRYEIDRDDRICTVGGEWDRFVRANGGPEGLLAGNVVGTSLWRFIRGPSVRGLYRACFSLARGIGRRTELEFRCDSPTERRYLSMRIARGPAGRVVLGTTTTAIAPWPRDDFRPPVVEQTPERLVMCAICRAIEEDDQWIPIDAWVARRGVDASFRRDVTHHEVCGRCRSLASRR